MYFYKPKTNYQKFTLNHTEIILKGKEKITLYTFNLYIYTYIRIGHYYHKEDGFLQDFVLL